MQQAPKPGLVQQPITLHLYSAAETKLRALSKKAITNSPFAMQLLKNLDEIKEVDKYAIVLQMFREIEKREKTICTYCKGIGHTINECGTHLNLRASCCTDEGLEAIRR